MPGEKPPAGAREETELLRQEVALQKEEVAEQKRQAAAQKEREERAEELKNRVSVAAIVLTTALSFIGNVRSDRSDAAASARLAAEGARRQGAELWAYYQTKMAEKVAVELARDRVRLDLAARNVGRDDPKGRLDVLKMTGYDERVRDFDTETQRVFFRVQELEKQEDLQQRASLEPARSAYRYELGSKLITLALILLSVTILSNKRYLLAAGVALGAVGLIVAFDGYFLFV
ncbi:MAG TPA: DUF4337 family protein [Myxococcales bacterium]|nr:DUF4337 family protein [Myxococcales bacterium]